MATEEARVIAQSSSITKWNVMALAAVFIGAVATLGLAEAWLHAWLRNGQVFPIGTRAMAHLPAGRSLVYYESRVAVPRDGDSGATLKAADADDEPISVHALRAYREDGAHSDDVLEYRHWLSGWSGRALWEIDAPAAGQYTLICHNHGVLSDDDLPADDRIAVLRSPQSFAQVRLVRTLILITGGTMTMTAVIILYLLHTITLQKRRQHDTLTNIVSPSSRSP
jgi:hypothetical protein